MGDNITYGKIWIWFWIILRLENWLLYLYFRLRIEQVIIHEKLKVGKKKDNKNDEIYDHLVEWNDCDG